MDGKLSMSQHCVLVAREAKGIPGCIRRSIASRSRELILSLCLALVKPHVMNCPIVGSPAQGDMELLEQVHCRDTKVVKGVGNLLTRKG